MKLSKHCQRINEYVWAFCLDVVTVYKEDGVLIFRLILRPVNEYPKAILNKVWRNL